MKQMKAPNGLRIVGTAETVKAVAIVGGWSECGDPVYAGGSEVDWDSQLTRTNDRGVMLVVDEDGQLWPKDMCQLVDE